MSMTYVFGSDEINRVKIGTSVAPLSRLAQVNTGSPFRLGLLALLDVTERTAHDDLRIHRLHGEWFELDEDVIAYIRERYIVKGEAARIICMLDEKYRDRGGELLDDVHVNRSAA